MKRFLAPLLLLLAPYLYGQASFSGLDLSPSNTLLFRAQTASPGYGEYKTLFEANLDKRQLRQLTFFPEQALLVGQRDQLQIQNRFGVFRTDTNLKNMAPVGKYPAFVNGEDIQTGKVASTSASPDGNYLLYLKQTDFGQGDLILYSVADGKSITVSTHIGYTLSKPPALWSPDSKFFVYSKGNHLYYYSIGQLKQNRVVAESYRTLGEGRTANAQWGANGYLYYLRGTLIYQIAASELFTRSLYSNLLSIGSIVGKIPFDFDPNFDRFWISPGGNSVLLDKGGRNLFLYLLRTEDFQSSGETKSLPYLLLPRNTRVKDVLWSTDGMVTLLTHSILAGSDSSMVFRVNLYDPSGTPLFRRAKSEQVRSIVLSPDGTQAAVLDANRVVIRDYRTWKDVTSYQEPDPLHALWLSNDELIVAGGWFTDLFNLKDGKHRLISLSQPGSYGFEKSSNRIETQVEGRNLALAGSNSKVEAKAEPPNGNAQPGVNWEPISSYGVTPPRAASSRYRVYTDSAQSMSYADMVMVRKVEGEGTQPLFPYPRIRYQAFPQKSQPVSFTDFTHGSRIRRREVALVFNAVDNVDGLTTILNTLKEYNLHCTFFVNGEFMRRNPGAVKEIADSGQEVGSLFFTYFNMTDSRFSVDPTFIKQGLGRTEDDYYALTGKELSLLWHAPYYFTNSEIIHAAQEMGYTYVGRDVDPLDWVTKSDALRGASIYLSASDIINRIMRLKEPGSIIPIRIGKAKGRRDDYIWNRLDVLINDLISLGYKIVPVSTLMEHAH